jgi:hypothetical protein
LASPIQANFKEICLDLAPPGGDSANAHYRLMSAYSHPSEFLLGQYINFGDAEGRLGLRRRGRPRRAELPAIVVLST